MSSLVADPAPRDTRAALTDDDGSRRLGELRATLAERYERVAVVHEWLTVPGGSEKVVAAMLELFDDAEIFTSVHEPGAWPAAIASRKIHATALARIPGARRRHQLLAPVLGRAFRGLDLSGFDLVISSNHASANHVRVADHAAHVSYCHTPMRYAWAPELLAQELPRALAPLAGPLARRLRGADYAAAAGPDLVLANSTEVADRVMRNWRRWAQVVHPPVDVEPLLATPRSSVGDHYLYVGRLVPYKHAEHAVAACERTGRKLKVVGAGRGEAAARAAAGPNTEFLGRVRDDELPGLFAGARGLLFPGEEDFGIVPVEALAAGLPVIAYGRGGVCDTVTDGVTGVLYDEPTVGSLTAAIERFETLALDERALREQARRFSRENFHEQLTGALLELSDLRARGCGRVHASGGRR